MEFNEDQFILDLIKAQDHTGDPSHGGKLVKKQIIDKNGKKQTEWVRPEDFNQSIDKDKKQDQSKDQNQSNQQDEKPNTDFIDSLANEDKAKLELIKEMIDSGDHINAKQLADGLSDEVKHFIPKDVWKDLHEQEQIETNGVKVEEEDSSVKKKESVNDKLFDLLKSDKFKKLDRKKQTSLILDSEQEAITKARTLTQNFSSEEVDDLDLYSSVAYQKINGYLRNPDKEDYQKDKSEIDQVIKNIDSAISNNTLEEDLIAYRALNNSKELKSDKAYQSTSLDPYTAYNFKRGEGDIFAIKLPKGTNYAYIGGGEKELLLPRDMDLSQYIVKENIKKSFDNLLNKGKQLINTTIDKVKDFFAIQKASVDNNLRNHFVDTIVFNSSFDILLLKRNQQSDLQPGKWWLPGGHLEQLEQPIVGAYRELMEETGLEADIFEFNKVSELDKDGKHFYFFTTILTNNQDIQIRPSEHDQYMWMSLSILDSLEDNEDSIIAFKQAKFLQSIVDDAKRIMSYSILKQAFNEGKISEDTFLQTLHKKL